ncbi:MAG: aminotransferase class I/II-fold pyridoxal phosphate-dependent enzyme [Actinomycetota bacterium]|nr:aminotransferase class I/II-fold pyridoxal phosphate-dependent enzyme [Actinomycetota bacterium]
MQAVILAAGRARRMQPISDHVHKALLPIGDSTILGRIVTSLKSLGVRRLTIVTGYRAQDIRDFIEQHYPELDTRYVHNSRFDRSNNIVSLAMAFDSMALDEDIILSECDLLVDPAVLMGLDNPERPNVAVVDKWRPGMDGTVVTVRDGYVDTVFPPERQGSDFNYIATYKTLNIYRFSSGFVRSTLQPILSTYANSVDDNCYYEVVLGMLVGLPRHRIAAHIIDPTSWIEVDDPNDLETARFHFEPSVRPEILDSNFGGHWNFDILDYSFISNPYFPPPALIAMLRHALPQLLSSYGSTQAVLNRKMALYLQCNPSSVQVLNGASQAFPILKNLWGGNEIAVPRPTFGEYSRAWPSATFYDDRPGVSTSELADLAARMPRIAVVNPNNPTGTLLKTDDLYALAREHPTTTLLVDESFIATSSEPSLVPLLEASPLSNVVVLVSLSKVLGIPGMRLGYLYSRDHTVLSAVGAELPIWNNSSFAEFFLEMLVKFRSAIEESLELTRADMEKFAEELSSLSHVAGVQTGAGGFLLVTFGPDMPLDGPTLRRHLLERHRIETKDVSGRFTDGAVRLRLGVRGADDNQRLVTALDHVLRSVAP